MKKISVLFLFIATLIAGCEKEGKTGSLEVTISYYYNEFIGYRPDVDARIFLFKGDGSNLTGNFTEWYLGYPVLESDTTVTVDRDYTTNADIDGVAKIDDIKTGKYLIVASSEGRFAYSKKVIEIESDKLELVKNFYYLHEFDENGEPW